MQMDEIKHEVEEEKMEIAADKIQQCLNRYILHCNAVSVKDLA